MQVLLDSSASDFSKPIFKRRSKEYRRTFVQQLEDWGYEVISYHSDVTNEKVLRIFNLENNCRLEFYTKTKRFFDYKRNFWGTLNDPKNAFRIVYKLLS